jgi:hypothetical protein
LVENLAGSNITVEGSKVAKGKAELDAVLNQGTLDVKSGGMLEINKVLLNDKGGVFTVAGGLNCDGTVKIGTKLINDGDVVVGKGGVVNSVNYTQNEEAKSKTELKGGTINNVDEDGKPRDLDIKKGDLIGTGTINGKAIVDGKMSFFGPSGRMDINGSLALLRDARIDFELGGHRSGVDYDLVAVHKLPGLSDPTLGRATLGGMLEVTLTGAFRSEIKSTDVFTILTTDYTLNGAFADVASGDRLVTTDGAGSFRVNYRGDDVILSDFQGSVPEPPSFTLLLIPIGLAAGWFGFRGSAGSSRLPV